MPNYKKTWFRAGIIKIALLSLLMLFSGVDTDAQIFGKQNRDRYKGVYGAKPGLFGKKKKKKYKAHKKKKKRKSIQKRQKRKVKSRRAQIKKRRKFLKKRKKTLYASRSSKKKKRKGRYPKSKAQLGSKLTIYGGAGAALTGQDEAPNDVGVPTNVYANYQPGLVAVGGIFYNVTDHFGIGGRITYIPSLTKKNESSNEAERRLSAMTIGVDLKYNILPKSDKFSPFVILGANYSFSSIRQFGFSEVIENPEQPVNDDFVEYVSIQRRQPDRSTELVQTFGVSAGAGLDYKLNKNLGIFVQVEYNTSFIGNKQSVTDVFTNHNANFNFISTTIGIRLDLFRKNTLY